MSSGVDLVRIGEPLRPEFAAWRYGSQLQWRRRRIGIAAGVVGVAGAAAATVAGPALLAAAAPLMGQALIGYMVPLWVVPSFVAVDMVDHWQWERVALRVASPQGRFRFDPAKRFPIIDYYITRVVKKDGKPTHELVDTLKDVRPE